LSYLQTETDEFQLFVTYHDIPAAKMEDIGKEEVFPASDNPAKLKRSCENAEHVGKSCNRFSSCRSRLCHQGCSHPLQANICVMSNVVAAPNLIGVRLLPSERSMMMNMIHILSTKVSHF
jgi:hypothetical protein